MRIVHSLEELLDLPGDETVNGFRRRESLQLEIPTFSHHALTDAQDALNSLQERGGSLVAASIMFLALAFTRWQFARRCREQYDELSRILREPAVLT